MNNTTRALYILITFVWTSLLGYRAVITQPVIDLYATQLPLHQQQYIPHSWVTSKQECPRVRQGLFNQIVEVGSVEGTMAQITLYNLLHIDKKITLWTNLHNIRELSPTIEPHIPSPLDAYSQPIANSTIATLTYVWHNPVDNKVYSPGTRFVRSSGDTKNEYEVFFVHHKKNTLHQVLIPKNRLTINKYTSLQKKLRLMVKLINAWLDTENIIPYVWGGNSIGVPIQGSFEQKTNDNLGQGYTGWFWPQQKTPIGCDCSGLITLAAQIFEIPYFCSNTTTIATSLPTINETDTPVAGNLLWIPGHVIILSNAKKHEIIESTGYRSGYGKVVRLALSERFKDISTYKELKNHWREKKPLQIIDVHGTITHTIENYKIVQISTPASN
jgi:hypothetical protein